MHISTIVTGSARRSAFSQRKRHLKRWRSISCGALLLLPMACVPPDDERIHCDDILAPEDAPFADVAELVMATNGKGCAGGAECHGKETAKKGYRFDELSVTYDAMTTHIASVYGQAASGEMPPEDEGTAWDEDDLRLVRSWYCNGAFPE